MKSIALVVSTILTLCQLSPTLQNETSLLSTKNNDLAPLYLIHPNFFFTSTTDRDLIKYMTKNEFHQEATLGFVAKNNLDCNGNATLIPVYRFKNGDTQNYILSMNQSLSAGTTLGYTIDGIAFYVSPTLNEHCGRTLPLHSYWVQTHYVYTNMNRTIADDVLIEREGGKYKGIVCHIWLNDEPPVPTPIVATTTSPATTSLATTAATTEATTEYTTEATTEASRPTTEATRPTTEATRPSTKATTPSTTTPIDAPTTPESEDDKSSSSSAPHEFCQESQYGCCQDGVSKATGPRFHGCDCKKSEFGCCPDQRTPAEGASEEGCSSCLSEPYGCCRDGVTPAHGPNHKGCCLETKFGCCPDNINEARGPNLEGCGCEYSPYGCCPDNKTSARFGNNDGCGCEHAPYGCCLDKLTPAQGPEYEGCPCHTFQFGCCPDGVTTPTAPHEYGCHCLQSEFKCCSDEVTPSRGPNFEGCTCANSKHGCCPDGKTDARRSNFDGCEYIPKIPQKACSLQKDSGACSNYTVKSFFDIENGACSRFWYSGCEGNHNRFETMEECKVTCEQAEGKGACLLPKIHGPCTGYYPSFYYDADRNMCSEFVYGGCLGNNNRFETIEACQQLCVVDSSLPPCDQPMDEGPCHGSFESWYFDKDLDTCRPFYFGGCKGNKNRYATKASCNYHCNAPGIQKRSCSLPKATGRCNGRLARWYHSEPDKTCTPFYYTGCDGNKNNFVSQEVCEQQCPPEITKDLCAMPAELGEGQNYETRWYYDTREERCRQFYYGGTGGSDNNFLDEPSCLARCEQQQKTTTTQWPRDEQRSEERPEKRPFDIKHCFLDYDSGECRASEARYYYNKNEGFCDVFAYGGCGGNENNFGSAEECEQNCGNVQGLCGLSPVYGQCQDNSTRWYYDQQTEECMEFTYSGCRGNKNNFYTEDECRTQCSRRSEPVVESLQPSQKQQEEIDVTQAEGDLATLRCFATEYPLPTITWKRNQAVINTNQGRYVNTTGGDLQIVGLRRSDSGTYVCVTDNGIDAPVEREVNLDVAGPSHRKPYILGDTNSIKVLTLNQPATIRCLTGGYPKPFVSWWRGIQMLPLSIAGREITRDSSLVFQRLELSDLGPYVCQAYSGEGRPVSMHVTLKAVGPVRARNAEDEQYLKYLVSTLEVSQQPSVLVTAEMTLPIGHSFVTGSEISITCNAGGFPVPTVIWYKNDVEIVADNRIQIIDSPHQLIITDTRTDDAGFYKCVANNNITGAYYAEEITVNDGTVQGINVPADCTDNPIFANCGLIVKSKYCWHTYYAKFCCRSCALAGQLYHATDQNY